MAHKRSATTELNHDNWNEENEPEEAGTFTKASSEVLEKRIVKAAKRRLSAKDGIPAKGAFGAFTGFKNTTTNSSPFSFLANASIVSDITIASATGSTSGTIASNGASKSPENVGVDKMEDSTKMQLPSSISTSKILSEQVSEKSKNNSSDYHAKLKGLNESVAQWIKTHVDANPFCILTPIFKDYEKYLKEIMSKEENVKMQLSHNTEIAKHKTKVDQNDKDVGAEKKLDNLPFIVTNASAKSAITGTEWKSEKSIFSNVTANSMPIFPDQKTENLKSVFSNTDTIAEPRRSIFGNIESSASEHKSIFGNASGEKNPFLQKSTSVSDDKVDEEQTKTDTKLSVAPTFSTSTFSFGQSSTTSSMTAGFSFGSAKPFSFAAQAVKPPEDKVGSENKDEDDEEPPKPDFKPVTEEGAIYEQRCKVFVKKDGNFSDRGIGMLFLKPTPNGKMQLIVRAETALGNLLLNTLLTQSIPTKRMNSNTIMLVCLPMPDSSPPPVPVLLRVKTNETADTLLETLNKHKK